MIRFADVIDPGRAAVGVEADDKADAIRAAVSLLCAGGDAAWESLVGSAIQERESIGATGIGSGVAIPHALLPEARRLSMAAVRLSRPVDFGAPDGQPVDLVFAVVGPRDGPGEHLQLLSKLARALHDPAFRNAARAADDGPALARLIVGRG